MATLKAIDSELFKLTAQLRQVRETAEDYLANLADKPDDPDLTVALRELETTEANMVRQMERLERTKAGLERRTVEANAQARLAEMRAVADKVNEIGARMERKAEAILSVVEKLQPLLQEYEALSAERTPLAYSLIREGEHKLGGATRDWDRYRRAATLKEAPISLAMTATIYKAGVGRIGPYLGDLVDVAGPNQLGAFTEHVDVRETMKAGFERQRELLQAGIDRAIANVTAQGEKQAAEEARLA